MGEEDKREAHQKLQEAVRSFYKAFHRAVPEGRHEMGSESFKGIFEDKQFARDLENYDFKLKDIDPADLFDCLDLDQDGFICWDEFRYGMMELREAVTPKQIIILRNKIQRGVEAKTESSSTEVQPADIQQSLTMVDDKMQSVSRKLADMESLMEEFCSYVSV